MDACLAGPPGDFVGHAFRVSNSLQPLTITPGGEEGLQEHGAQPLLHRCRVSAFSEQGVWLPGPSLDSTIQPPGPRSPHSFRGIQSPSLGHSQSQKPWTNISCPFPLGLYRGWIYPVSFLTDLATPPGQKATLSCVCVLNDLGCLWCRKYWGLRVRL